MDDSHKSMTQLKFSEPNAAGVKSPERSILIGQHATAEEELSALRQHVHQYRAALNQEGIWLFLATLGCWSVTQPIVQIFAFGLAALLFGNRLGNRLMEKDSLAKLTARIAQRLVQLAPDTEVRNEHLGKLDDVKKIDMSMPNSLRSNLIFLCCWIFYGVSFGYSILHLPAMK